MKPINSSSLSLFLVSMAASGGAAAAACNLGSYNAVNGTDTPGPCVAAPAGSYVNVTGATAYTLASPGTYQPASGQTSALQAEPGYYVPGSGAIIQEATPAGTFTTNYGSSVATPAPVGSYQPETGRTNAIFAPVGTYIPTTGASSATQTTPGFYTYGQGASTQVPAGLFAGPMNTSIRANEASIRDASVMLDDKSDDTIKASFYYQGGSVDQLGQSSGARQNISFWGLNVLGNILGSKEEPAGVMANITSANYSAGSDGNGNGLGLSVGLFKKLQIQSAKLVGTLLFGNYQYNSSRQNISQRLVSGSDASLQTATGSTTVNTYGANLLGSMPLTAAVPNLDGFLNIAVTNYSYKGMNETVSGAGSNPSAGLNSSSMNYVSIPATIGFKYYLMDSSNKNQLGSISVGYKYDFGQSTNMNLTTQSSPSYQFGLPIALTNARGVVLEIATANYELQKDLTLSAAISSELSTTYSFYQGNLRLRKSF